MAEGGKLTHSISQGSEFYYDLSCSLCDDDGLNMEAVGYCSNCCDHLCQTCYATHCKPKPLRHHKLLDKHKMPTNKGSANTRQLCTEKCQKHEQRAVRFYCQDHEKFACGDCAAGDHTDCNVQHIQEEAKKVFEGFEIKMMHNSLQILMEQCDRVSADSENSLAKVDEVYTKLKKSLKEFRRLLNTTLDYLEHEIEATAKAVKAEDRDHVQKVSQTCVACTLTMKKIQNKLVNLEKDKKHCDMFVAMKKARKTMEQIKQTVNKSKSVTEVREYKFEPNKDLHDLLSQNNGLGELLFAIPDEK